MPQTTLETREGPGQEVDMRVRSGRREEVPAVMALIRRVVPLMQAAGNFQWDDRYPDAAAFERDADLGWLWLAEVEGRLAGVAAITTEQEPEYAQVGWDPAEPAVVVHRLAVDPDFRGRGIAMGLMVQAEAVARASGLSVLRVDTHVQNPATRGLFPKLGYTYAGEIGLGFRPGQRFACFEKRLGASR